MAFLTGSWLIDFSIIVPQLILGLYIYFTWTYNYWKDRNVDYAKPTVGLGSLIGLLKGKSHPYIIDDIYKEFDGKRYCGFFQFRQPILMVRDPKLIEQIMIKDFSHFEDRPLPLDPKEPLTSNLVNLRGNHWRSLRHKLTPTFSSGKLKGMLQQMCSCGDNMLRVIDTYSKTGKTVEAKEFITAFSLDVIASCAFGLQFDPSTPEGKQFLEMVNKATGGGSAFSVLRAGFKMSFPKFASYLGIRSVPEDAHDYFMAITKATIEHRLKKNIKREDFFQLLLGLMAQEEAGTPTATKFDQNVIEQDDIQLKYEVKPAPMGDNSLKLTDELIAAQTFVFLTAGSETVSTTISTVVHYVATHPEVQSRLHAEIDQVLSRHGSWTYQALKEMTYMDQVIQETQRIFSVAHVHMRVCTAPYKVPDSDLLIERGILILIPTHSIHSDPANYPNPDTFDPNRFEGNNYKPSSTFSPFGDGPRICIAMRFALLEMKVCVAKILSKYHVKPSPKTLTPLRYDSHPSGVRVQGGIWVSFHPRSS